MTSLWNSMLERLPWDSEHFGLPVARIMPPTLTERELAQLLGSARQQGFSLVYWAAEPYHPVPDALLSEYCGALVDLKTVFSGDLERLVSNRDSYASTIVAVLVLGGLQLLALGVMGEYLGRVHLNINRKPQYTIREVLSPAPPSRTGSTAGDQQTDTSSGNSERGGRNEDVCARPTA
jgi:hypothetical protein